VDALSAGNNAELMAEQVMKYQPRIASLSTPEAAAELKDRLIAAGCKNMPEIMFRDDVILAAATIDTTDTVVTGIISKCLHIKIGHFFIFQDVHLLFIL
jgi:1-deoxy-D-xylulose-5-phosphate reductoisomerase